MRLDINLASHPYQDVRRILMRWGTLTLILMLCSIGLIWYTVQSWRQARDVNQQIARVRQQIRTLDADRQRALDILERPENKTVAEQSKFLNGLIARKSFSWTRAFMELEKVLPTGLHVLSMNPDLRPDNQLELKLKVGGESREKAIELVRRLEQSQTFKDARLEAERMLETPNDAGDRVEFDISAVYISQPRQAPSVAEAQPAAANGEQTANARGTSKSEAARQ